MMYEVVAVDVFCLVIRVAYEKLTMGRRVYVAVLLWRQLRKGCCSGIAESVGGEAKLRVRVCLMV